MPAHLILNADDFGLTRGINRAIGELSAAGVLTSATLMARSEAFDDAVEVARGHPALGVGCHIVLTDGTPVSPPASIPSLIGSDGKTFRPSLSGFISALFLGRVREEDVAREALAQVQKLQRVGIQVTHLDTHKHTHLFPKITRPLLKVAEQTSVHAMRNPFEPKWSLALSHGIATRRFAIKLIGSLRQSFLAHPQLRHGTVRTTDGTVAISATGQLDSATLGQVLAALPTAGTYEVCCHPGYNDRDLNAVTTRLRAQRDVEREALLTEVTKMIRGTNTAELVDYGDLTNR